MKAFGIRPALPLAALVLLLAQGARAQFTNLFTFTGSNGENPYGAPLIADGYLYGTTSGRATLGMGTIFRMDLSGSNNTILHSFPSSYTAADGAQPRGDLLRVGGTLYGSTYYGGANSPSTGFGTLFKMDLNGSNYSLLHVFTNQPGNGQLPGYGSLAFDAGYLYGTTTGGGASNNGAVFRIGTNGAGFTLLHSFTGAAGGQSPENEVVLVGGRLYGTTTSGGSNSAGTVFSMAADGSGFTVIHHFRGGTNGSLPRGSLAFKNGKLYGTTEGGGASSDGILYRLDTNGANFEILHPFTGNPSDGSSPKYGGLLDGGQYLYGMTFDGGTNNRGAIFQLDPDGGYAVLHSFTASQGRYPYGGLALDNNILYGMTANGGSADDGTLFAFRIPEPAAAVALALAAGATLLRRRRTAQ